MNGKCTQIALGGVFSSLCLLMMFLTAMLPFSSFAMPMLAGAMLAVVMIENGAKTAVLVYITVSLLSVFIVPDLEAKLMFISFFGYYSILKPSLEKIRPGTVSFLVKMFIFNTAVILGYIVSLKLFGLGDAAEESDFLGKYGPAFMLAAGNLSFILYDFLLTVYLSIYIHKFRPVFLRR